MSRLRDVAAWCENDDAATICTPTGNVKVSYKALLTDFGTRFVRALALAAVLEHEKAAA